MKKISFYKNRYVFAFTLAEILITLVIIGVVAALTVPPTIAKYQKEETVTRLKKAYSALAQTTARAIADYGPIATWEITNSGTVKGAHEFSKKYLFPYLSVMKDCGLETTGECGFDNLHLNSNKIDTPASIMSRFYLSDGSYVLIRVPNCTTAYIYIDINGRRKPNLFGRDTFFFCYYLNNSDKKLIGKLLPWGFQKGDRNKLLNATYDGCNRTSTWGGAYCAAVIIKDGWQIKDDYPW